MNEDRTIAEGSFDEVESRLKVSAKVFKRHVKHIDDHVSEFLPISSDK